MTFSSDCPSCGVENHVELFRVGQHVACEGCRKTFKVPAPRETIEETPGRAPGLRFACPGCGRKYATKPDLAGKKIKCGNCGAGVRVPGGDATPVPQSSRSALKAFGKSEGVTSESRPIHLRNEPAQADSEMVAKVQDSPSFLDELASIEGVKPPKRAGAVLPSRSETIEQVRQKLAEQQVVETQKEQAKPKKKKKKKKGSSTFDPKETLNLVMGVGLFVAVLAGLSWRFVDLRFPIGGLLCVIGFVVYLLGSASLRQLVAEEGAFKALLFRFCPPYQWWYVITHWSDTKDFVAFFASGMVILALGGAVIKTSPIGVKAEASERAYQKARAGNQTDAAPAFIPGVGVGQGN